MFYWNKFLRMNNTSTSSSRISPSPLHSMTSGSQVTSSPLHMTSPPLHMTSSPLHITSSPLHMASSQLHMTSVSPFLPTMSNHIQTSPVVRGFQAPFMGTASFLSGQNVMAAPASTNPKSGTFLHKCIKLCFFKKLYFSRSYTFQEVTLSKGSPNTNSLSTAIVY